MFRPNLVDINKYINPFLIKSTKTDNFFLYVTFGYPIITKKENAQLEVFLESLIF